MLCKNERMWPLETALVVQEDNGMVNGKMLLVAESEWL